MTIACHQNAIPAPNLCTGCRDMRQTPPPSRNYKLSGQLIPVTRRNVLSVPGSLLMSAALVGPRLGTIDSAAYQTIGEAIRSVAEGTVINISPGIYRERIILDGPSVTLQASPEGSDVTIIHETDRPYEATVYATSGSSTLRGLRITHRSPSLANNYAVFVQGAHLRLEDCEVTSATGSGIGLEGGELSLSGCRIQGCKQHGIALFNSLEGSEGSASVRNTIVSDNGLDGILLRDGASLTAENVHAMHNARHGYNLSGGSGSFKSCLSSLNGKGAVEIGNDFDSATSQTQIFTKAR